MRRTVMQTRAAPKVPAAVHPARAIAAAQPVAAEEQRVEARPAPGLWFNFGTLPIQAKLTVGQTGDALEQEADRVADRVMRTPGPAASVLQRQCATGEAGGEVQRKDVGGGAGGRAAPPIVHEVLRSPGQPLDGATRAFMGPRLGHAFDQVRVHADARAADSAGAVGARAYTVGQHVVFGAREYRPETPAGQRLLAHELVHVLQQGRAPGAVVQRAPLPKLVDVDPDLPTLDSQAIEALTTWLERVRQAQGGTALRVTPELQAALADLEKDPIILRVAAVLRRPDVPDQPAALARALVTALHPADAELLKRIDHLRRPVTVGRTSSPSLIDKVRKVQPPAPSEHTQRILENAPPPPSGGPTAKESFIEGQLHRPTPGPVGPVNVPFNFTQLPDLLRRDGRRAKPLISPVDSAAIASSLPPAYFDSDIPGEGASSGIDLEKLVTIIALQLQAKRDSGEPEVVVDLGSNLPLVSPDFETGLQMIVDQVARALQLPVRPRVRFRYTLDPYRLGRPPDKKR